MRALQKLARAGTLTYHGDLKPENIIVKPSGSVVMVDPAMRCDDGRNVITTTPHYNPLLLTDQKADVMSIGVMLTGRRLKGSCGGTGEDCSCDEEAQRSCALRRARQG